MLSNDWPRGTASYNNRQENLEDNYSLPAGTIIILVTIVSPPRNRVLAR